MRRDKRQSNNRNRDSPRGFRSGGREGDFDSGYGSGANKSFHSGGQRGFNSGPREMHKATCSECGEECEVPFKPIEGRPIFCRTCFAKKRQDRY